MVEHDDENAWITNGPAAWFVIAFVALLAVSFTAWGYAEFRAHRAVNEALKAISEDSREDAQKELDLHAQRSMATASTVSLIISTVSTVFLAVTVLLTIDTSKQSRKALKTTLEISRRELMPYVVVEARSLNVHDRNQIQAIEELGEEINFNVEIRLNNNGKTPYYVKSIYTTFIFDRDIFKDIPSFSVLLRKIIDPGKSITVHNTSIPGRTVLKMRESTLPIKMRVQISCSDIFSDDRFDFLNFIVYEDPPVDDDGLYRPQFSTLLIQLVDEENPLRSWVGTPEEDKNYTEYLNDLRNNP